MRDGSLSLPLARCLQCERFRADDEENSVIPRSFLPACLLIWPWCEASWVERWFFEGALADAPAWARSDVSTAAERMASVPVMVARHLNIASSIWPETIQQNGLNVSFDNFCSTPYRRLVVVMTMMISTSGDCNK
jgi:hypothetical protein